ncbi:hypothetical protein JW813_04970 [Clostridium botulinum]|uniref:hypothetical protein n=1 Tax=Clostridium botulinum TaxID=1491 RepID=UPI0006A6B1FD|nr:hypothetical protein [Clostridium botulinum]KAI3349062.1 hypothetical protein CIT18_10555 [Clostridium botulinum]KOM88037.1 hypothetical protein ACP51_10780 [Clostridium botulinum]KOR62027.1 hypothetical protein ADT22_05720 [Clostridium botulinum]MBY7023661.1 hypothetical protein [Clostridium botulinum]NFR78614.1 hypothetical protein [Clostridium botulinum]
MGKKVALVKFLKGSFDQEYSYYTNSETLNKDDLVIVQAGTSYGLAKFTRYSTNKIHVSKAEKWIIKNITPDVQEFEAKLFLGGFD